MSPMMEMMAQQLGGQALAPIIAQQLGVDPRTAQKAVQVGLPLIIAALARNSQDEKGRDSLHGALQDHDGGRWNDVQGYMDRGGDISEGNAILEHIFGGQRHQVEQQIGRETGMDPNMLSRLLPMLAPLVLAYMGNRMKKQRMQPNDLSDFLSEEQAFIQDNHSLPRFEPAPQQRKQSGSAGGSIVESLLDQDGDGSMVDDVGRIGIGILGKILSGKR